MKNKKILYLCGDMAQVGGIEKYNKDFLSALSLLDIDVTVIERSIGEIKSKLIFIFKSLFTILFNKPDYIICAHINFTPVVLFAHYLRKIPYSVSLYGIEAIKIRNEIHNDAIRKASKLIVISEYTKSLISNQFDFHDDKYFMLPSSVNANDFILNEDIQGLRNKFSFTSAPLILTLSRLSTEEEKGQHRVLQALPAVLEKIPNAVYVIAGPGNDDRVNQILDGDPNLRKSVTILGGVSDEQKNDLYNLCDVFILPSKNEGFGIVFIEALACGAEVIASDGYGCREGLYDGVLGKLVDPDNITDISNRLCDSLSNSDNLETRKQIRAASLDVYGYDQWCDKIKKFIAEVVF